jgi:hypothetical protein
MNYLIINLVALKCIMQVKIKSHAGGGTRLLKWPGLGKIPRLSLLE